jgi:hypothetical protein
LAEVLRAPIGPESGWRVHDPILRLKTNGTYLTCLPKKFQFGCRSMHRAGWTARESMRQLASAGIRPPGCSAPCPPPCGLPLDLRRTSRRPDSELRGWLACEQSRSSQQRGGDTRQSEVKEEPEGRLNKPPRLPLRGLRCPPGGAFTLGRPSGETNGGVCPHPAASPAQ